MVQPNGSKSNGSSESSILVPDLTQFQTILTPASERGGGAMGKIMPPLFYPTGEKGAIMRDTVKSTLRVVLEESSSLGDRSATRYMSIGGHTSGGIGSTNSFGETTVSTLGGTYMSEGGLVKKKKKTPALKMTKSKFTKYPPALSRPMKGDLAETMKGLRESAEAIDYLDG